MTAKLEIICVGNELLIGKILNTNAQWIAKQATGLAATVNRITIVADDVTEIANAIREALQRKPQFIITTGGLGPTFDDKTLKGIAKALNRKLQINPEALRMVKQKYETYTKEKPAETAELTPPRKKMAALPEKTEPLPNPVGTAPGIRANLKGTVLIALPGVPKEMEAIFTETVAPTLRQATRGTAFHEKSIYANHIMESTLAPLIDKVMHDNAGVYVKSHPKGRENKPHMEIHFSIKTTNSDDAKEKLDNAVDQLSSLIRKSGGKVFTEKQLST